VRTYPQATAGVPQSLRFDPSNGAFRFVYRPDPRISAPTVVFVSPLHYPGGFTVVVRHGRVVSRHGRLLSIRAAGTDSVTVVIGRR
jgi:endoglycosylceramidase